MLPFDDVIMDINDNNFGVMTIMGFQKIYTSQQDPRYLESI